MVSLIKSDIKKPIADTGLLSVLIQILINTIQDLKLLELENWYLSKLGLRACHVQFTWSSIKLMGNSLEDWDQPQPRVFRQSNEKTNSCNYPHSTNNCYRNLGDLLITALFKMKNYCIKTPSSIYRKKGKHKPFWRRLDHLHHRLRFGTM